MRLLSGRRVQGNGASQTLRAKTGGGGGTAIKINTDLRVLGVGIFREVSARGEKREFLLEGVANGEVLSEKKKWGKKKRGVRPGGNQT